MHYHPLQESLLVDKNYEKAARHSLAVVKKRFLEKIKTLVRDEDCIRNLCELDIEAADILKPRINDNYRSILARLQKAAGIKN